MKNWLLWSLLPTYTLLVVWYHGVTAPRPSSSLSPTLQRHDEQPPQLPRLALGNEIMVAIPDGQLGTDLTASTTSKIPDSTNAMQQQQETISENHSSLPLNDHHYRSLQGGAGGGYPSSLSEEQVMQVLVAVLLLLLVCILFMCCCCGRFSMCDCLALVCIWEICCNDGGIETLAGDFVSV